MIGLVRTRTAAILVAALVSIGMGSGPASAAKSARTITLHANKTQVGQGEKVVLSGKISSSATKCVNDELVKIQANQDPQAPYKTIKTTHTNAMGKYSVVIHPQKTQGYRALAPATTACVKAASDAVVVYVTG